MNAKSDRPHPESEKLWCEEIDVGEEAPRQIASGLRQFYANASDLEGKGRIIQVRCLLSYAPPKNIDSNNIRTKRNVRAFTFPRPNAPPKHTHTPTHP